MRRWFLLLVIVLLPLRGWAGASLMADMPMHGTGEAQAVAAALHDDCMGHADAGLAAPAGASGHHGGADAPMSDAPMPDDCATCAFCQVCSTVAILVPQMAVAASEPTPGSPAAPCAHFLSADAQSVFKPPIS